MEDFPPFFLKTRWAPAPERAGGWLLPHKAPSINRVSRTLPAWLLLSQARVGRLLLGTEWVPARTLLKSVRGHPTRTSGKLAPTPFSRERLGLRYASGWRRDLFQLFPSSIKSSQRQEARRQALEEPPLRMAANLEGMRTFVSVEWLEEGPPLSLFPQL